MDSSPSITTTCLLRDSLTLDNNSKPTPNKDNNRDYNKEDIPKDKTNNNKVDSPIKDSRNKEASQINNKDSLNKEAIPSKEAILNKGDSLNKGDFLNKEVIPNKDSEETSKDSAVAILKTATTKTTSISNNVSFVYLDNGYFSQFSNF